MGGKETDCQFQEKEKLLPVMIQVTLCGRLAGAHKKVTECAQRTRGMSADGRTQLRHS